MLKIEIRRKSLGKAGKRLSMVPYALNKELHIAVKQGVNHTVTVARLTVPYRHGALERSIVGYVHPKWPAGSVYVDDKEYRDTGKTNEVIKSFAVEFGRKTFRPMVGTSFIRFAADATYDRNRKRILKAMRIVLKRIKNA